MWVGTAFNSEVREGLYERKMEMERKETDTSDMELEMGEILEIVFNWYILYVHLSGNKATGDSFHPNVKNLCI